LLPNFPRASNHSISFDLGAKNTFEVKVSSFPLLWGWGWGWELGVEVETFAGVSGVKSKNEGGRSYTILT
jgi:hypothetical protein